MNFVYGFIQTKIGYFIRSFIIIIILFVNLWLVSQRTQTTRKEGAFCFIFSFVTPNQPWWWYLDDILYGWSIWHILILYCQRGRAVFLCYVKHRTRMYSIYSNDVLIDLFRMNAPPPPPPPTHSPPPSLFSPSLFPPTPVCQSLYTLFWGNLLLGLKLRGFPSQARRKRDVEKQSYCWRIGCLLCAVFCVMIRCSILNEKFDILCAVLNQIDTTHKQTTAPIKP